MTWWGVGRAGAGRGRAAGRAPKVRQGGQEVMQRLGTGRACTQGTSVRHSSASGDGEEREWGREERGKRDGSGAGRQRREACGRGPRRRPAGGSETGAAGRAAAGTACRITREGRGREARRLGCARGGPPRSAPKQRAPHRAPRLVLAPPHVAPAGGRGETHGQQWASVAGPEEGRGERMHALFAACKQRPPCQPGSQPAAHLSRNGRPSSSSVRTSQMPDSSSCRCCSLGGPPAPGGGGGAPGSPSSLPTACCP